jgi:pimeloyl-ACP methyl ester carboxylesterase
MSEKINHQRRRFLGIATMTIATTQLGRFGSAIAQSSKAQPKESATTQPGTAHTDTTAIRPFRINISKEALVNLRHRITATQWPEKETVTDLSQGLPLATMQKLARCWATDYDWRKVEAKLNTLAHFITEIDGLDIHFIHVRSRHENTLPLIVTHGWPGSIIEQLKIIDPLTNPTAHGGKAEEAFHVVILSMPGYGFSGKSTSTGWGVERMARAWDVLMKRLGYTRYIVQGDLGCVRRRADGCAGTCGIARHPHQLSWDSSSRRRQGARGRRTAFIRPVGRGNARLRAVGQNVCYRRSFYHLT